MEIKILKIEDAQQIVNFIVQLNQDEFAIQMQKVKDDVVKNFSSPGFRKGHVPLNLVNKHISQESILFQTIYGLNSQIVNSIITTKKFDESNALESAIDFQIVDLGLKSNQPPTIKISFEKFPKILNFDKNKLEKLISIEKINKLKPTDEAINLQLKNILKNDATIIEKKEQILEKGDIANIDFEGFIDNKPFANGSGKNYDLEIGSKSFIDNFEDQLINLKKGDHKEINVTFPKDYSVKDYAQKQAKFKVIINCVKTIIYPKLDQTLIEKKWKLKNIDNKDKLIAYFKQTYWDNNFAQYVSEIILKEAKISYYPQSLIKTYMDQLIFQEEQKIKNMGFKSFDDYFSSINPNAKNFDEVKANYHNAILGETKKHILLGIIYQELLNEYKIEMDEFDKKSFIQTKLVFHYDDEKKACIAFEKNQDYYSSIILKNKLFKTILSNLEANKLAL